MSPSQLRPRVLIISRSFLDVENRKIVHRLGAAVPVRAVSQRRGRALMLYRVDFGSASQETGFRTVRIVHLFGAQYLHLSLDLGMREHRPDIVQIEFDPWQVMFWQAIIARALFCRQARVLCVVKKNTYRPYPGLLGRAKLWLARTGCRRVDRFIAAGRMVASMYSTVLCVPPEKIEVSPQLGVDSAAFRPATSQRCDPLRIGYTGRLEPHKGLEDLVEAMSMINQHRAVPAEAWFLGAGHLRPYLAEMALLHPWVRVFPPVPRAEVPDFLGAVDIFVMPSRILPDHQEHDGYSLIEAMSTGLCCVGTSSGVIPEILGDAGVIVDAGDSGAMATAIQRLLDDGESRVALGLRARQRVEELYSLEVVVRDRLATYVEVFGGHDSRS